MSLAVVWVMAAGALLLGLLDLALILRRELPARYRLMRRRVLVHSREPATYEGVLAERWGTSLVLRDVRRWDRGQTEPYPVDGDVVLDRERVEWLSEVPAQGVRRE